MAQADQLGPDALDFWLGTWSLSWGEDGTGTNRIGRILDDRVIEEAFAGSSPRGVLLGRSLSVLDEDGSWRQTWVDSSGSYLDFIGVEAEGRIAFERTSTSDGVAVVQRMVWLDVTPDSLRWQWQDSRDGRATWRVNWEIAYRRA
jgi:hypothetical protein